MVTNSNEIRLVRIGIGFLLATYVMSAVYTILLFSAPMLLSQLPGFSTIYVWLVLYSLIIVLVTGILNAVGQSLLLALPRESRATAIALLALACNASSIIVTGVTFFIRIPQWLSLIVGAASLAGMAFQVLWIRRAALWRGSPDIAATVMSSFYFAGGFVLLWSVLATVYWWEPLIGRQLMVTNIILMTVPMLLLICVILGFMRLIRSLRLLQLALDKSTP